MTQKLSSLKIILYLLACLAIFYSVYFVVASIIFAIYSMDNFDGKIPFDFKHWIKFENSHTSLEMGNEHTVYAGNFSHLWCSFGSYIPRWVWDFCLTTTFIHVILSCIVMLDIPRSWTWWICLTSSSIMMVGAGEGIYHLLDWRKRRRVVIPRIIGRPAD